MTAAAPSAGLGAAALAAGLVLGVSGCMGGPHRLAVASTPDRLHRVEIIEERGHQALLIDGQRGSELEAIAPDSLVFDGQGRHIAYAVRRGAHWSVARDHCPGPEYEGVGDIVLSPDGERLAYLAQSGGWWRVVLDGVEGAPLLSAFANTLRFAAGGGHIAIVAQDDSGVRVFLDQNAGPPVDGVGELQLSPEGIVAYAARRGSEAFVVVGETRGATYARVGQLQLGASGEATYAAERGGSWLIVHRGVETSPSSSEPELAQSEDGLHVAWIAHTGAADYVWLDGALLAGPYPSVRRGSLVFGPRQAAPSFVVRDVKGGESAIVAGARGPAFDELGSIVFSADGDHFAYQGRRGRVALLQRDGQATRLGGLLLDPVLSPDGQRVAYTTVESPPRLVVDGRAHAAALILTDTFSFSRDSRHWAVLAGDASRRLLRFVVDGQPGPAFDFTELASFVAGATERGVLPNPEDAPARPDPEAQGRVLRGWVEAMANAESAAREPRPAWLEGKCQTQR